MKLIVYLVRQSRYAPPRVGKFDFNPEFNKWLYLGRPLTVEEFNKAAEMFLDTRNRHVGDVTVRAIEEAPAELPVKKKPPSFNRAPKRTSDDITARASAILQPAEP